MTVRTMWKALVILCCLLALPASLLTETAQGQSSRVPRIEGVSYGDLVEWDAVYGTGLYYYGYGIPRTAWYYLRGRDGYTRELKRCSPPLPRGPLW